MNRVYNVIWNHVLSIWIVVGEYAKSHCKKGRAKRLFRGLSLLTLPLFTPLAAAELPSGGQIVLGQGQITQPAGNHLSINQDSARLAIDWQQFSIGHGHRVSFHQPSAEAIALNRVIGTDGSRIMGQLDANGRVFLINPNGVLFGKNAQVDVGGLVASTLDISNEDFAAGNYRFRGNGNNAAIINKGRITAADGGAVALLGGHVSNEGVISARLGSVALLAGEQVTLDFAGDGLLKVQIDEATRDALVENHQLIQADGGQVLMSAHAADALLQTVVNNTGVIEARTLENRNGKIVLLGGFEGGTVEVAGKLDASAPEGGDGGFIDTSGAYVKIHEGTQVTTLAVHGQTGDWLIDPTDFIVSAGSAPHDASGIGAETLSANLENNNVTLQTVAAGSEAGDIHVNAEVSWDAATTLTLSAHGDIHINQNISATSGKLALEYGQGAGAAGNTADYHLRAKVNLSAGQNFSTRLGNDGTTIEYTVITELGAPGSTTGSDLQGINGNLSGHYALGADIDASATAGWNGGAGFNPIGDGSNGNASSRFSGSFHGLGHEIHSLTINRPLQSLVGLFGWIEGGEIRNLGLRGGSISGDQRVGALAGSNDGQISHSYATAAVSGFAGVGGLVGVQTVGSLHHSFATGQVSGHSSVGGLAGVNDAFISHSYATGDVSGAADGAFVGGLVGLSFLDSNVIDSYATGNVSGNQSVGGLFGSHVGTISRSYATGDVSGADWVGGLVGEHSGTISQSYATGDVSGADWVGGLVGVQYGTISQSYAIGDVSGADRVGGLVGEQWGTISQSYATGYVSGSSRVGGLVGLRVDASISTSFWDADTTMAPAVGEGSSSGITAINAANRFNQSAYAGFDFDNDWFMIEGETRPFLRSEYSTDIRNAHQLQLMAMDLTADYRLVADIDANATSGANPSGMWSAAGFQPIGNVIAFSGSLDGLGHEIHDLTIERPSQYSVGLFGDVSGSSIRNLGLRGVSVSGRYYVGGLVGRLSGGTINQSYVNGAVSGEQYIGGLVGLLSGGTINQSYAAGAVSGDSSVGGLVGYKYGGTISQSYATGEVSGEERVGGLVGENDGGTIWGSYATNRVSGTRRVGGLVGEMLYGTINQSYATGAVSGDVLVGGLVGELQFGTISQSYATGAVRGTYKAGGLVGELQFGTISQSYWNTETTGQISSDGGGTGLTTAQMRQLDSFAGWDIDDQGGSGTVWRIYEGHTTPLLRAFLTPFQVDVDDISVVYNGTSEHALNSEQLTHDTPALDLIIDNLRYQTSSRNIGSYSGTDLRLYGLYSTQLGYDIILTTGELIVDPAALTISSENVSKTYDGTTDAAGTAVAVDGTQLFGGDTLSGGVFAFTDKNVGLGNKTVTVSDVIVEDGNSGNNYSISYQDNTTSSITPATLIASGGAVELSRVYDGTTRAAVISHGSLSGLIDSDKVELLLINTSYDDKHVGTGKRVSGTYSISGADAGNYVLMDSDFVAYASITPRVIQVVADDQYKLQGQSDPVFTWRYDASAVAEGDDVESVFFGALSREAGEAPGSYLIGLGDLQSHSNYAIDFVPGELRIEAAGIGRRLGARATAYQGILVAALNAASNDANRPESSPTDSEDLYTIVDGGLRLPEGL